MQILDRKKYDVRFLEIPLIPEKRVESYIRFHLSEIYPGHSHEFPFFYRLHRIKKNNNFLAIIIFLKNIQIPTKKIKNYICLSFFIPECLSQVVPDWSGSLLIEINENIECVTIKKGIPSFSKIIKDQSTCPNPRVFRFNNNSQLTSNIELLKRPRSIRKARLLNIEKKTTTNIKTNITLSLLSIIFVFLILELYENEQSKYIEKLTDFLQQKQAVQYNYIQLSDKAESIIHTPVDIDADSQNVDPYKVISTIYQEVNNSIIIENINIEKNILRIEGYSIDPMMMTEKLSKNKYFKDLSIDNMIPVPSDNTFHFSLRGTIDE